ncbi:hypothetical protein V1478_016274 [Vespula squamosa]|uniref:Uncharacterized protein n=1 Tax=Vespula squamosa TaxID=30214 RepID=A0ABD1ZZC3_VESSQ
MNPLLSGLSHVHDKRGHHDDRIEHKREAPEGVTGHKTPRLPSTLASRCRDYPINNTFEKIQIEEIAI